MSADAHPPASQYRMIPDESVLCCEKPDSFFLMHSDGGGRRFAICFNCRRVDEQGVGRIAVPPKKRRPRQEDAYTRHMGTGDQPR